MTLVQSHVCIFKKRPDPSRYGSLRWSLPLAEICFCQSVIPEAQVGLIGKTCPESDEYADGELWFADEHLMYQLTLRHNWKRNKMDEVLDRIKYCGESRVNTNDVGHVCLDDLPLRHNLKS